MSELIRRCIDVAVNTTIPLRRTNINWNRLYSVAMRTHRGTRTKCVSDRTENPARKRVGEREREREKGKHRHRTERINVRIRWSVCEIKTHARSTTTHRNRIFYILMANWKLKISLFSWCVYIHVLSCHPNMIYPKCAITLHILIFENIVTDVRECSMCLCPPISSDERLGAQFIKGFPLSFVVFNIFNCDLVVFVLFFGVSSNSFLFRPAT